MKVAKDEREGIFRRVFGKIELVTGYVAAYSIIAIAFVAAADVIHRFITGNSLRWAFELSMLLVVLFVWSALGYGQSQGKHIRVDMLISRLSVRAQRILLIIVLAGSLVMFGMLGYAGWGGSQLNIHAQTDMALIPMYPFWLTIPLGALLICIRMVLQIIDAFKGRKAEKPAEIRREEL